MIQKGHLVDLVQLVLIKIFFFNINFYTFYFFYIIKNYIKDIQFITADKVGWDITYARIVTDWKFSSEQLHFVPEGHRMEWFMNNCNLDETAFIGDGYYDAPILEKVKIGIAPSSARKEAKQAAKFITESAAGSGAVLDACLYLKDVIINEHT